MQSLFRRRRSNYKIKTADHWNIKLYFKIKLWFLFWNYFRLAGADSGLTKVGVNPVFDNFPKNPRSWEKFVQQKNTCTDLSIRQPLCGIIAADAHSHRWEFIDLAILPTFLSQIFKPRKPREFDYQDIWGIHPVKAKWQTTSFRRYVPEGWQNYSSKWG